MEPTRQSSVVNGQQIDYSNPAVQQVVSDQALEITKIMVQALIVGHQEGINFKQLAEKHINPTLVSDIQNTDQKVQSAYANLFRKTIETITNNSQILVMTLAQIEIETGDQEASGKFLGSFVLPEVDPMLKTLDSVTSKS